MSATKNHILIESTTLKHLFLVALGLDVSSEEPFGGVTPGLRMTQSPMIWNAIEKFQIIGEWALIGIQKSCKISP